MNAYTTEFEITTHQIDQNGNIRPTAVAAMMQEAGTRQLRDRGPDYYELFFSGKSLILTRLVTEYIGMPKVFSKVDVKTWLCKPKAATLRRCFAIEKDGELLIKAYSEWALYEINEDRLCKTSEVDFSNCEGDEPIKLQEKIKIRLPKDLEYKKVGTKEILYSDVDMNLHMNNTKYQDMIWQYIDEIEKKEVVSTNIRFRTEGSYGSIIDIYLAKGENTGEIENWYFYTLIVEGKKPGTRNIEGKFSVKKATKNF